MKVCIRVFALEYTQTHTSRVTPQGFGFSTELIEPKPTVTTYRYYVEHERLPNGSTGFMNGNTSIDKLAHNMAENLVRKSELFTRHTLQLRPNTEDEEQNHVPDGITMVRPLSLEEGLNFAVSFQVGVIINSKNKTK